MKRSSLSISDERFHLLSCVLILKLISYWNNECGDSDLIFRLDLLNGKIYDRLTSSQSAKKVCIISIFIRKISTFFT